MLKVALELPANKFLWLKAQVGIEHLQSSACAWLAFLSILSQFLSVNTLGNKTDHFPFVRTLKELSRQDGNTTMPTES